MGDDRRQSPDGAHFSGEQRLAFGRVAELYHEARPGYPPAVLDELIAAGPLGPGALVVDVGAGTGKLSALLAARGLQVLAIEPSAEMARVAGVTCRDLAEVTIVVAEFERWTPPGRAAAVVSAQAWHWVDPALRYRRAHAALGPGGLLAAIWTFPDWDRCALRDTLRAVYRDAAPELQPSFPMHPASAPERLAGDWSAETVADGLFAGPTVSTHRWAERYDGAAYARLLATHQDHILMGGERRERLLAAVAAAVDGAGGLELPLTTTVCLAHSAG